jgi:predicted N-formylglutamate amidohydrolase
LAHRTRRDPRRALDLPHVTSEVRQDLIASRKTAEARAERRAEVLRAALSDRKLCALNRS